MRTSLRCCVIFILIAFAISGDIKHTRVCPEHEHFFECFSRCEEKCEGFRECETGCFPGCGCDYGYARNDNSEKCVRSSECPQKSCKENEIYDDCYGHCQMNCEDPYGHVSECSDMCASGCICKRGYVRGDKGKCVLISECPGFIACPNPHEIHLTRLYSCGETCQNPYHGDNECDFQPPGCFCDFDTLKDEITGECKSKLECRKTAGPYQKPINEKVL